MNLKKILSNKVVKAGSWYTVTEFFVKGLAFLTIPIFTRLLSTSDYGTASLYTTWMNIFTILIGLSLNTSIMKAKYDFKDEYDDFVRSITFLSMIVFGVYLGFFAFFGSKMQELMGMSSLLVWFMLFQAYFNFVRTSLITKFRVEYNYKKISLFTILINILGILLSIILIQYVFTADSYLGKVIGNGILIIVFGVGFLIYMLRLSSGSLINKKYWKYALAMSLPMIFHALSGIINTQFDRIVINRYVGDSATGLYSFAYNIGMIMVVLTHAFDQAWSPWVYETMEKDDFSRITTRVRSYRAAFTTAYGMILLASPELIRIMAAEAYWESLVIIPYIFAGYYFSFMYTLEVKTEFFYRKTNLISMGTILSAIINVVLNLIFVPIYGYVAAAATTTVSYFALFVFHYIITSRVMKRKVYGLKFHLVSIVYMFVVTMFYVVFIDFLFIRILGIVGVLLFGYMSIKDEKF